jgi:DHA1 family tetracycline resistance protein-like MFS transporter
MGELGPRVPFYATGVLAVLNATFGYFALPETLAPEHRRPLEWKRANPLGAFSQMRHHPMVLGLMVAYFFFLVAHQALPSIWAYFTIARFNWSQSQIGLSLAYVGVLMMICQAFLIRWVIDRYGSRVTAYLGLMCAFLSFLGYTFANQPWMVFFFMTVGAAQGFLGPSVQGIMSARISANAQGELQGAIGSLASLASIVSPPVMTGVFGYFTAASAPFYFPGSSFLLAALLTLLSFFLFAPYLRKAH